ncbi:MAG: DinB family protein [Planctomycetes bacterium]|nr:DinB family protein [Planctomycetota bacterium]
MSEIAQLLAVCDENFGATWDSVLSALKGVSANEAAFQHPCYAMVPADANMPPAGSILWQMAHLSVCKQMYARILQESLGLQVPEPVEPKRHTAAILLHELRIAHSRLRSTIAALRDEDLSRMLPESTGYPGRVDAFIRTVNRHDSWHAGQIALARRLYKNPGVQKRASLGGNA